MNNKTTDDLDITTDESTDWRAATIVGTDEDAALIAGFLNSNGIPAEVESLHASEFPADFGRLGEVHVMVPAERLDEALQLLAQSEAETPPPADNGD
jgi:hypothetical protein